MGVGTEMIPWVTKGFQGGKQDGTHHRVGNKESQAKCPGLVPSLLGDVLSPKEW